MKPIRQQEERTQERGYTLIELMVSMLLGLFIITTVTQIFLSSNESNSLNRQLGLMQEAARIAMTEMASDIRMAGHTGCESSTVVGNALLNNSTAFEWLTAEQPVQGLNQSNALSQINSGSLSEGLLIFKLNPDVIYQVTNHNTSSNTLTLDTNVNGLLTPDNAVGIIRQDCSQVSLIALSSVSGNNISHATGGAGNLRNCFNQLKGDFRCYDSSSPTGTVSFDPGFVRPLDSVAYFIKLEDGLPTLFRKDANNTAIPLVDGIEAMRVYYGLDTDGNGVANRYINAGERAYKSADWKTVTSIRIHLLVRSEMEVTPGRREYFFNGVFITPPDDPTDVPDPEDRFLRKEYIMTMALRNQG